MRIKVIGVGHTLGGDDFVGIKVVEELSNEAQNDNIELITTTDPSKIIYLIEECDFLIIVDAVIGEKEGEVYLIDPSKYPKYLKPISSHGFEVTFAIEIARKLGIDTDNKIKIVGITIKNAALYSDELSENVRKAIPRAKEVVKKLLNQVQ